MRATIGLFLLNKSNDYQLDLERDAVQSAEKHGLKLDVHDAGGKSDRQLEQILAVLRGPEAKSMLALLVHPVYDGMHEDAAREAGRAGIGWVLLNREADYVDDLRRLHPSLTFFCVTPDQREIGRAQGRLVRALLAKGGKVLCITGPLSASSSRLRRAGMEEMLVASGVQVVFISGDWSNQSGAKAVRNWELRADGSHAQPAFRGFFPDVVVAHNDAMAEGARRALGEVAKRRGWPKMANVPVVGCDGTRSFGARLVNENVLAATVVVPSTSATALDLVASFRRDRKAPAPLVRMSVSTIPELGSIKPLELPT